MLTISPIKIAAYPKKYISFGEYNHETAKVGLRSLDKSSKAKINFEKDLRDTRNADMVQSNPIKALGYNLVKAYNILCTPTRRGATHQAESKYVHIPYMA